MIKNSKKLFLIMSLIFTILCFSGCSNENDGDVSSIFHADYFYEEKNEVLIDNKVIVGVGNSVFNENNENIMSFDERYFQEISNICISIFVDEDIEPKTKIEIPSTDFFSNKYIVKDVWGKRKIIDDYKKTYTFNLRDYEINSVIKFVVSMNWNQQENFRTFSQDLTLYGEFINDEFIIRRAIKKHNWTN